MKIRSLQKKDFPEVALIYKEGLLTGIASFETEVPTWRHWNEKFLEQCRYVATLDQKVIGWCALSAVSKRAVYRGVAETTIYMDLKHSGKGYGQRLLKHLIKKSEIEGFWTLQASIFTQNLPSIKTHHNCGFVTVGIREKIGQREGIWYDNLFLERRSKKFSK